MNKHYIKTNSNNLIIEAVSDAFPQLFTTQIQDYICIEQNSGRQLQINGKFNPSIFLDDRCPKYKYDNGIIELSEAERTAWRAENIEPIVDYDAELATDISAATNLEELKTALIGGGKAKIKGRKK